MDVGAHFVLKDGDIPTSPARWYPESTIVNVSTLPTVQIQGPPTALIEWACGLLRQVVTPETLIHSDYRRVSAAVAGVMRDVSAEVDEWSRRLDAEAAVADWNAARQEAIDDARENDHAA